MNISREQHDRLLGLLDDTIEYFCDEEMLSGELAWTVTECWAKAKLAEIKGAFV